MSGPKTESNMAGHMAFMRLVLICILKVFYPNVLKYWDT